MLEYLKIMEYKLNAKFSTPTIIGKRNNVNYKGYVNKKLNKELSSGDTRCIKTILDSFWFKILENIKTEEPLESDEESLESEEQQIVHLSEMPPIKTDEEEVKKRKRIKNLSSKTN